MPLTDTAIKTAKPGEKPYKLADEKGLYLLIQPSGGKWWRLDYRFDGKRKTPSMGTYPEVGLKAARDKRDDARRLLSEGIDPGEHRKIAKATRAEAVGNAFEVIAREWYAKKLPVWSQATADKAMEHLAGNVFPWIGTRPITDITAPELLTVIRRIEERGALETAQRCLQRCGEVFRYAIATGRAERNPAADLRGALTPKRVKHHAAITDPAQVAELLRAIDGFKGTLIVQCALRLSPLVFVRPGELRQMKWAEIDQERTEWRIPAERMKQRREHIVPLSQQALAILEALRPLTGHREHVFIGARDYSRPMSGAAINAALRRMGYDTKTEITGHGFRAMARTILHEELGIDTAIIEHQLAHSVPDALGEAYNRTKILKERKAMMQRWADYLDKLKAGAEVIALPGRDAA